MPVISTIAAATARAFGAFKAAAGGAADEFFNYVTLLLHGDGTNGAQNNTFLDSSTNNFTITRNGNTTQGTFSPFSQDDGKWGAYFDGSGDYLTVPNNTDLILGTGDCTIECWVYPLAVNAGNANPILNKLNGSSNNGWLLGMSSTSQWQFSTGANVIVRAGTVVLNTWTHLAAVRASGTTTLYVNGVSVGATASSFNFTDTVDLLVGFNSSFVAINAYVSNVRVVKGSAVYTSAFTPSTTPLTAITNTSLLTCQSNRFKDNSANNFAITVNGNTSIQPFSPFAPSAAYSAAVNGGSGYFDGSGDYLTVPSNTAFSPGSGDWTFEGWFYVLNKTGRLVQFSDDNGNLTFNRDGVSNLGAYINGVDYSFSTTPTNSWVHFAISVTSGTCSGYLNGTRVFNFSGGSATSSARSFSIGAGTSGGDPFIGYISNLRYVKGTGVYSGTTITVPTTPSTAITNTSLLLNFTNAGILDNTGRNDLETVGNAQISTSVKKFGTGSFYTGATSGSHYLRLPAHPFYQFGTENFTIEGWFQPLSAGNERTFYMHGVNTTGGMALFCGTGGVRFRANGSSDLSYSTTLSSSDFTHIAFVRDGTTRRIFINGTQVASDTLSFNVSDNVITDIGATAQNASDSFKYYGYIDDLRITKGVARYTSNFTPPTAAFEDQ